MTCNHFELGAEEKETGSTWSVEAGKSYAFCKRCGRKVETTLITKFN